MSRIHEALKKAASQGAPAQAVGVGAWPQDILEPTIVLKGDPAAPLGNGAPAPPAAKTVTARADNALRFEDIAASCTQLDWNPDPNVNAFNPELGPHCGEQFRVLRSRLDQLRANRPLRSILITSAVSGEGKTFVSSNLAQAIVRQADRRALLIDADLRRSHLHVPLGAPSNPGLSGYLRGVVDEMAIIQRGVDPNLYLIPGGDTVTNPSELLSNGLLKRLLNRVTTSFDWIIIDSPPCLPIADAGILAELCDGLLFVVRANSTPVKIVRHARQKLDGKNILGVVLNAAEEETLGYSSYYSGYAQSHSKEAKSQLVAQ
jgi:protein-tyrosine kinase